MEKTKILILGTPDRIKTPYNIAFAQPPQGPMLKEFSLIPNSVRQRINHALRYFFNPMKDQMQYIGMHFIKQNLERDVPNSEVEVVDYPDEEKILEIIAETWYSVVAISISSETGVLRARNFARNIKRRSKNPDVKIIFGNYGAVSGKIAGALIQHDGEVLWNSPIERKKLAEEGKSFYSGEGVRDIRLFFKKNGMELNVELDDPVDARIISRIERKRGRIEKLLAEKLGLNIDPRNVAYLPVAFGCDKKCYFCNTSKMFDKKMEFYRTGKEIFNEICRYMDSSETKSGDRAPGIDINIFDENFTRPMDKLVELCELVCESGRDIKFSTFSDVEGLHKYLLGHGDFIDLLRGGLRQVWFGIESREDFFKKRGGATPKDIKNIVNELQKLGIIVIGSHIVGLPYHTEGNDEIDENGRYRKVNIHNDFAWGRKLNTAGYQVMMETFTYITNPERAEPLGRLTEEEWGHKRTNPKNKHRYIDSARLEELDLQFRKLNYIENGPMTIRTLVILWEAHKNLRNSDNPIDRKIAVYYYTLCKTSINLATLAVTFATLPVFEKHSSQYLQRAARFFKEIDEIAAPDGECAIGYERLIEKSEQKANPFLVLATQKLRRFFVKNNLNLA